MPLPAARRRIARGAPAERPRSMDFDAFMHALPLDEDGSLDNSWHDDLPAWDILRDATGPAAADVGFVPTPGPPPPRTACGDVEVGSPAAGR